jgi:hypothetical protein
MREERNLPLSQEQKKNLDNIIRERIEYIIKNNPKAIIKINNRYEITRTFALFILNSVRDFFTSLGASFKQTIKVILVDENKIIVRASVNIQLEDGIEIMHQALGACEIKKDDIHASVSTAETRAVKRLIETLVGEDTINQMIEKFASNIQEPLISKNQKELLTKLLNSSGVNLSKFTNKDIDSLTYSEASSIIQELQKIVNKSKKVPF